MNLAPAEIRKIGSGFNLPIAACILGAWEIFPAAALEPYQLVGELSLEGTVRPVRGVPDDRWGEAVKAVVVLREGSAANADALIVHCHTLIAGYKCPKTVDFADALPKSGAGKILKSQLRDPHWEGEERGVH